MDEQYLNVLNILRFSLNHHRSKPLTDETPTVIPVDGTQAAILYTALETAIEVADRAKKMKVPDRLKSALSMQISAYKAEQARLAAAFPVLRNGAA